MSMQKINSCYSTVFEKLNNEISWAIMGSILICRYLSYNLKTQHKICKKIDIYNEVIIIKLLFSYFVNFYRTVFYNFHFLASLHVRHFQLKNMATLQSTKDDKVAANGGNLDNSIINARAVLPIKSCRNLMKFPTFCCRRHFTRD